MINKLLVYFWNLYYSYSKTRYTELECGDLKLIITKEYNTGYIISGFRLHLTDRRMTIHTEHPWNTYNIVKHSSSVYTLFNSYILNLDNLTLNQLDLNPINFFVGVNDLFIKDVTNIDFTWDYEYIFKLIVTKEGNDFLFSWTASRNLLERLTINNTEKIDRLFSFRPQSINRVYNNPNPINDIYFIIPKITDIKLIRKQNEV